MFEEEYELPQQKRNPRPDLNDLEYQQELYHDLDGFTFWKEELEEE